MRSRLFFTVSYFFVLVLLPCAAICSISDRLENWVEQYAHVTPLPALLQRAIIPGDDIFATNIDYEKNGLKAGTGITYTLDRVQLEGTWIENNPNAPTVIMFHGNGFSHRGWWFALGDFNKWGFNICAFSLRGYGSTAINPNDNIAYSTALDIEAIIRFCRDEKKIPLHRMVTYGYSLGGACSVYAARYFNIPAILDSTFTSLYDIFQDRYDHVVSHFLPGAASFAATASVDLSVLTQVLWLAGKHFIPNYMPNIPAPAFMVRGIIKSILRKSSAPQLSNYGLFKELGFETVPPNTFDNCQYLRDSNAPVMMIYGLQDELMGKEWRARQLCQAAASTRNIRKEEFIGLPIGHRQSHTLPEVVEIFIHKHTRYKNRFLQKIYLEN